MPTHDCGPTHAGLRVPARLSAVGGARDRPPEWNAIPDSNAARGRADPYFTVQGDRSTMDLLTGDESAMALRRREPDHGTTGAVCTRRPHGDDVQHSEWERPYTVLAKTQGSSLAGGTELAIVVEG